MKLPTKYGHAQTPMPYKYVTLMVPIEPKIHSTHEPPPQHLKINKQELIPSSFPFFLISLNGIF